VHLNESLPRWRTAKERFGRRPTEVAYDAGLLGRRTIAAHCVWLSDTEIALMPETGTQISHNPSSNAKLGNGIALGRRRAGRPAGGRIRPGTAAARLVFDGTRCVGADVTGPDGAERIEAGRVIVCAGAYGSPALLMRSGIGPEQVLARLDADPVSVLPGVGANLADHPWCLLDVDVADAALIEAEDADAADLAEIVATAAELLESLAKDGVVVIPEDAWWRQGGDPVAAVRGAASSYHHHCGTCRMGDPDADGTVVGPDLAVLGTRGLAVADSSVMPVIPRANTNLASMMIGHRAADVITS
jgi:choline dehydrogenase-like flavoprotein